MHFGSPLFIVSSSLPLGLLLTRSGGFFFAHNLQTLQPRGISLPSPACILGAVLFGLIGFEADRYRKRARHPRNRWPGVALMRRPSITVCGVSEIAVILSSSASTLEIRDTDFVGTLPLVVDGIGA